MSRRVSGVRAEKVNTRQVLMGNFGAENGTALAVRRAERQAVLEYWPVELIDQIIEQVYGAPPWTLLQRPTTWDDERAKVVGCVAAFLDEYRHWPKLDDLMRHVGRVSNHRAAGEAEGQESLLRLH